MSGRKQGSAYQLYGFFPKVLNGKHIAICKYCNRTLKNTAASRLHRHRNSCLNRRGKQKANLPFNPDNKLPEKTVTDSEFKEAHCSLSFNIDNCKTEITSSINDENDDQMNVIDSKDDLLRPLQIPSIIDKENHNGQSTVKTKQQPRKRILKNIRETVNKMRDVHDNNDNGVNTMENVPCNFNGTSQLRKQLANLETVYYHKKAEYFAQLTAQSKMKQTLMALELEKLQLELQTLNKK